MSLGVMEPTSVEDEVSRCVRELGGALPIQVAWWRFQNGCKPLLASGVIADVMQVMELKGLLVFNEGRYELVKEVSE